MGNIISVDFESRTVCARDLYKELEISDRFSRWFERMTAHGFIENEDFTSVKSSTLVNNGKERVSSYYIGRGKEDGWRIL